MNKLQFDFSHCNAKCFSYVSPPTNISCQLNPSDPVCLNKRWRKFEGFMNLSAQWTPTPIILDDIEVFHIVLVFVFFLSNHPQIFLATCCQSNPDYSIMLQPRATTLPKLWNWAYPCFRWMQVAFQRKRSGVKYPKVCVGPDNWNFLSRIFIGRAVLDVSRVHISCLPRFSIFQNQ